MLPAFAQCIMCYKAAEGAGSRTIQFLKLGIMIMLIPTLFIFAAIALMVYRRRKNAFHDSSEPHDLPGSSLPALPHAPETTSR
jgi:hypothetical protein